MTEKQQYLIDSNPLIQEFITLLDCEIIESESDYVNRRIASRIEYWFQQFSTTEKIKEIENNASQ